MRKHEAIKTLTMLMNDSMDQYEVAIKEDNEEIAKYWQGRFHAYNFAIGVVKQLEGQEA